MAQLNYHHLYYFYVTAREGSIAKAAHFLHLTPQTVSGQLSTFESYLGTPLFDRLGKRLILNPLGKLAYDYAEQIFASGHELLDMLMQKREQRIRTFTIGITDAVPKILAFDLLHNSSTKFDSTRFIYREGDFDSLCAELAINRLDLIIADRNLTPGSNVKAFSHVLGESSLSFFAPSGQAEQLIADFPYSLQQTGILLSGDKSSMKHNILAWFERLQINPKIVAEFDDSAMLKLFGQEGHGVFAAPTRIAAHICQRYNVSCIGETTELSERYYAICAERISQSEIVSDIFAQAELLA
jgi:LysR family transcriptional regulator, transcriptional activator of nhaA